MHQLDDLIAQTWFRTSGAEPIRDASAAEAARAAIEKAQKKAVAGLWDLPFSFNISLEQKNIERTTVSAQEITGYFRKEVEPAFAGLDERLRLICELDWLILFYRAVKIISGIPGAAADRGTAMCGPSVSRQNTKSSRRSIGHSSPDCRHRNGYRPLTAGSPGWNPTSFSR